MMLVRLDYILIESYELKAVKDANYVVKLNHVNKVPTLLSRRYHMWLSLG